MEHGEVGQPTRPRWPLALRIGVVVAGLAGAFTLFAASGFGRRALPSWAQPFPRAEPGGGPVTSRVVPEGVRIRVEVLNGTDGRGLARSATAYLRDAGFDVVFYGNSVERRDTTIVRDRRGHAEWAEWAREVMRPAVVEAAPDSGRLVDLSIVVGARWQPPPDPLRP
ncbi:MAG: LytR C-terminal domain-containing protein [Gemmatimonadaceae bacterium]|nr:LytR C-terminal domain-containing protein [Gemmatimonadaceae bacterium]